MKLVTFWFCQMLKFQALWHAPKWSVSDFYRGIGILRTFRGASGNCEIVFRFGAVLLHLFISGEEFLKKHHRVFKFSARCFFLRSALQFYLQRSGNSLTVRWKFENSALKIKKHWEAEKKAICFGRNVKKCIIHYFGRASEYKLKSECVFEGFWGQKWWIYM